jgi:hypothetical protein
MGSDVRKKRIALMILAAMVVVILVLCGGSCYSLIHTEYKSSRHWIDCPILVESRAAPLIDTIPPFELVLTNSTMVEIDVEALYWFLEGSFSPDLGL